MSGTRKVKRGDYGVIVAGGGFAGGVAAGAGAALLGVLVGAWLSNRRGD